MDRLDAMRVFVRVMERRSFTRAAEDLGLPRSTVTDAVKQTEARLGTRLLQRTTRHVTPTLDGEAYHLRCLSILAEVEDAESAFSGAVPKGTLRIDVQGKLARHFVLPNLKDFLRRYPGLSLQMSEGDRLVDLVQDGVDCVLRAGTPQDSDLTVRHITLLPQATLASPEYLAEHGVPTHPDDLLAGHRMVGFRSSATGGTLPLEFLINGQLRQISLPVSLSVNGADSYSAAAVHGFGLVQIPRYHADLLLAAGSVREVLPETPPPGMAVSVLYPRSRQLSPRLRVFIDWLVTVFAATPPASVRRGTGHPF